RTTTLTGNSLRPDCTTSPSTRFAGNGVNKETLDAHVVPCRRDGPAARRGWTPRRGRGLPPRAPAPRAGGLAEPRVAVRDRAGGRTAGRRRVLLQSGDYVPAPGDAGPRARGSRAGRGGSGGGWGRDAPGARAAREGGDPRGAW